MTIDDLINVYLISICNSKGIRLFQTNLEKYPIRDAGEFITIKMNISF